MTYRGRVENGQVAMESPGALADGTVVEVRAVSEQETPTHYDRFKDILGSAEGLPSDASRNHDHYLYGTPKK